MRMKKSGLIVILFTLLLPVFAFPQTNQYQDVNFFNNRYFDANQSSNRYAEGMFENYHSKYSDTSYLGAMTALMFGNYEFAIAWYYSFICWDGGGKANGFNDPTVYGKYNFYKKDRMSISGGSYVTLPIGSEKTYGGYFNFGFWLAMRYLTCCNWLIRSYFGIGFYQVTEYSYSDMVMTEKKVFHNNYYFGAGGIKKVKKDVYAVVDFGANLNSVKTMEGSAGVEYRKGKIAFRGAAGFKRYSSSYSKYTTSFFKLGARINY